MREASASPRLRVGLIGAGRAGTVIARAFERVGHPCVAVTAISDASRERAMRLLPSAEVADAAAVCAQADLIIIATPDAAIADVCSGLVATGAITSRHFVTHLSGRHGLSDLASAQAVGAAVFAMHPAMTFTGASEDVFRVAGAPFAISASQEFLPIAQALVLELDAVPHVIADADRALYHAALAHASNHLVTIYAQGMELLRAIGISDAGDFLRPIVEATVSNAARQGDEALTGPIARGDLETVEAHLRAMAGADVSADIAGAYRALALATMHRRGSQYGPDDFVRITDA